MTDDLAACYVWRKPGIESIGDLKGKKLHFGASGIGINADLYARILRNLFGVSLDIVYGYKSGTDVGLAMERGEIEGNAAHGAVSLPTGSTIAASPSCISLQQRRRPPDRR